MSIAKPIEMTVRRPSLSTLFLAASVLLAVGMIGWTLSPKGTVNGPGLEDIPEFNGERAFGFLNAMCDFGPRPSNSEGMHQQQQMLSEHFSSLGARVTMQEFRERHPETGEAVPMANMIIQWNPESTERILLCAHYDTRPYPDLDPDRSKRRGIFLGANDGASGVALLCELAYHMARLDCRYGVDFVLFDGEEFVFDAQRDRDRYFLGAIRFAHQYAAEPPGYTYRWGVLLDMVADEHLDIYKDRIGSGWPDTRPLYDEIWGVARDLGVDNFINRRRYDVRDDHIPLHDIAGIPTCDIIDFNYKAPGRRHSYWHTTDDTPEHCSALSLAKVGWVVLEWLRRVE